MPDDAPRRARPARPAPHDETLDHPTLSGQFTVVPDDDAPATPRKRAGVPVWAVALIVLACSGMAAACGAGFGYSFGKRSGEANAAASHQAAAGPGVAASQPAASAVAPDPGPVPVQDYDSYVAKLKQTVPYFVADFAKSGLKAETFAKHGRWNTAYAMLVVKIDPVTLRDKSTGMEARYTRAKLVLAEPSVQKVGMTLAPHNFRWATVEMMP